MTTGIRIKDSLNNDIFDAAGAIGVMSRITFGTGTNASASVANTGGSRPVSGMTMVTSLNFTTSRTVTIWTLIQANVIMPPYGVTWHWFLMAGYSAGPSTNVEQIRLDSQPVSPGPGSVSWDSTILMERIDVLAAGSYTVGIRAGNDSGVAQTITLADYSMDVIQLGG